MTIPPQWRSALRLLLVTDGQGDPWRIERIAAAAITGGVRAVQVRERSLGARQLAALGDRLRQLLDPVSGLAMVNDRVDVALAGHYHGVQLGHRSLPVSSVRILVGDRLLLGASAHDADGLGAAQQAGADFAILAPVWPTTSKPTAPSLGIARAQVLTQQSQLPVVWLGGATPARLREAMQEGCAAAGFAVRSALCSAADPAAVTVEMLAAITSPGRRPASRGPAP